MQKQNLVRAHQELYRRGADEQFDSLAGQSEFAGDRTEADERAARLLDLVAA